MIRRIIKERKMKMAQLTKQTPLCFHFRKRDGQGQPISRDGLTVVFNPLTHLFGIAKCHPVLDNFSRRTGRVIAESRAASRTIASGRSPCVHIPFRFRRYQGDMTFENVKHEAFQIADEFGFEKV